jgi:hypothetical protein
MNGDTDSDRSSDGTETLTGTDPTNPRSHTFTVLGKPVLWMPGFADTGAEFRDYLVRASGPGPTDPQNDFYKAAAYSNAKVFIGSTSVNVDELVKQNKIIVARFGEKMDCLVPEVVCAAVPAEAAKSKYSPTAFISLNVLAQGIYNWRKQDLKERARRNRWR